MLAPADDAAAVLLLTVLSSGMPMGWGAERLFVLLATAVAGVAVAVAVDDEGMRCRLSLPLPVVAPAADEASTPAPLLALDLRAPLLLDLSFLLDVDPPALADAPPPLPLVCAPPPDDDAPPADGDALLLLLLLLPPRSDFQKGIPVRFAGG